MFPSYNTDINYILNCIILVIYIMAQNKTLIGKHNYLFLINDSAKELEVHCNNLNLVQDKTLSRFKFKNFLLIVFPNKSLVYKQYLPDEYKIKYRPALDHYKNVLTNTLVDTYDILKNEEDVYYKTDTHINIKGSYIVYKYFIQKLNELYRLDIKIKECVILNKIVVLSNLQLGIGDLLWDNNLGNQIVDVHLDSFYYSDDIDYIYCKHKIQKQNLELFEEVYMIKEIYNNIVIDIIKPDFVFEFRVERFLF
jgi:hypothetical protein